MSNVHFEVSLSFGVLFVISLIPELLRYIEAIPAMLVLNHQRGIGSKRNDRLYIVISESAWVLIIMLFSISFSLLLAIRYRIR